MRTYLSICRWLFVGLVTFVIGPSLSQACDRFPVSPGVLVREYTHPNGLTFREYDSEGKGTDYGTATPPGKTWPLFYARGFDDPAFFNDPVHPFVASVIWTDKGEGGKCEDIVMTFIRQDRKPWNPDKPGQTEVHL